MVPPRHQRHHPPFQSDDVDNLFVYRRQQRDMALIAMSVLLFALCALIGAGCWVLAHVAGLV